MNWPKAITFLIPPLVFYSVSCMAAVAPKVSVPGVYVNELQGFSNAVTESATAVPAFIGYTEKAQWMEQDDLKFIPQRISSLSEFENYFGNSTNGLPFTLHDGMQLYFANGGTDCYVVSIGGYDDVHQIADFISGLDAVSQRDEPTLLLFPEAVNLPGNDLYAVQNAALKQAAELGDRFCILDLKFAEKHETHDAVVREFRRNVGSDNLSFGAAYTPYLKTSGDLSLALPSSPAVAGQYVSVDENSGVWIAPTNVSLNDVAEVAYAIDDEEQGGLNLDEREGKSINAIRNIPGRGVAIWGASTLAGNDDDWRYISVRRFYSAVSKTVKTMVSQFVFQPNDANTWNAAKLEISRYLAEKWHQGGLFGSSPKDAFSVRVGQGETMTAEDILDGRMNVEISMALEMPGKFINIKFSQQMVGDQIN